MRLLRVAARQLEASGCTRQLSTRASSYRFLAPLNAKKTRGIDTVPTRLEKKLGGKGRCQRRDAVGPTVDGRAKRATT